jgi:prevent-host-death family protein
MEVFAMAINIVDGIRSITDLKRNTNQILKQIHETKQPVVLTVNGKAEAVLMGAREYEHISSALSMFKLLIAAEEDVKNNRIADAQAFFREFRHGKEI